MTPKELKEPEKPVFDPRKDKLLDITTSDDGAFEQSLIKFRPPGEELRADDSFLYKIGDQAKGS